MVGFKLLCCCMDPTGLRMHTLLPWGRAGLVQLWPGKKNQSPLLLYTVGPERIQ